MYLNVVAVFFVLIFIVRKIIVLKKPVYIYETDLIESRPIEMIGVLISLVGFVIVIFDAYLSKDSTLVKEGIIYLVVTILLFIFTVIDYKKFKVGIYENGILFRSNFYSWNRIYTYRYKNINEEKDSITFYIHNRNDENKLLKFRIVESKENAEKIIESIGENIDTSRS